MMDVVLYTAATWKTKGPPEEEVSEEFKKLESAIQEIQCAVERCNARSKRGNAVSKRCSVRDVDGRNGPTEDDLRDQGC
jgi:hypothetical protein